MNRPCCRGAAAILPGALLVLLPKCPLCLALWLTAATGGLAISATAAEWIRWALAAAALLIVCAQLKPRTQAIPSSDS